jgi:hypothetical protein
VVKIERKRVADAVFECPSVATYLTNPARFRNVTEDIPYCAPHRSGWTWTAYLKYAVQGTAVLMVSPVLEYGKTRRLGSTLARFTAESGVFFRSPWSRTRPQRGQRGHSV